MKYIEITDRLSVSIDDIIAVEDRGEFGSIVHTNIAKFETPFPRLTLLSIIEGEHDEDNDKLSDMSKNIAQLAKFQQHFVG